MINYIVQIVLIQAIFLAVYDLVLQRETFFKINRIYLLLTPFLSFVIPLLKFESLEKAVPQKLIVQLPTVVLNPQTVIEQSTSSEINFSYLAIIFYFGVAVFSVLFIVRIYRIFRLISKNKIIKHLKYNIVILIERQSAFSFFNYIFVNQRLLESKNLNVIRHEIIHCKQKHSIDLMIFELLKIIMWFNPLVYVYQKRITLLHEYISDSEAIKEIDKEEYFNKILAETFTIEDISFVNQFLNKSLIKERIIMITKNKSKKIKQLKYLVLIPLLLGMLIYSSCKVSQPQNSIVEIEKSPQNKGIVFTEQLILSENFNVKSPESPVIAGERVLIISLTTQEKAEYDKWAKIYNPDIFNLEIYQSDNGKKDLFPRIDKNSNTVIGRQFNKPTGYNVPIYPGCEGTDEELRECFKESITKYVSENFNKENLMNLEPGLKTLKIGFGIDNDGIIRKIQFNSEHEEIRAEIMRIFRGLPKMDINKNQTDLASVWYNIPFSVMVN